MNFTNLLYFAALAVFQFYGEDKLGDAFAACNRNVLVVIVKYGFDYGKTKPHTVAVKAS